MLERFTDEARALIVTCQVKARRLGHHYIGCEHLMLCVAAVDGEAGQILRRAGATPQAVEECIRRLVGGQLFEGVDREALATIGIDLDAVRARIEAEFGTPRTDVNRRRPRRRRRACIPNGAHIPFTPRAKKCLELAVREATALRAGHIGAEHLLLGLTRMNDGIAPDLFAALRISPSKLRTEILGRHRKAG